MKTYIYIYINSAIIGIIHQHVPNPRIGLFHTADEYIACGPKCNATLIVECASALVELYKLPQVAYVLRNHWSRQEFGDRTVRGPIGCHWVPHMDMESLTFSSCDQAA
jgi:hypothetical protein